MELGGASRETEEVQSQKKRESFGKKIKKTALPMVFSIRDFFREA